MRLSLMLPVKPSIQWDVAAQLGVKYAITKAAPELSDMPPPSDFNSLKTIVQRFKDKNIKLIGLEGDEMDMSRIKLGLPGRDQDIELYQNMLRNMGKLGIEMICYNFMAGVGWFRSKNDLLERGGALTSGFDASDVPQDLPLQLTEEKLWDNYNYFIQAVIPVAEEAGVKMGLHPDDPPVSPLLGFSRIFTSADAYRKAMSLIDSPAHGITFCQATMRAMGEDVFSLIPEWKDKIVHFHFRDIVGTRDKFRETFHDNGPTNMSKLMDTLKTYVPNCLIRPDHTPTMAGESNDNVGYAMLGNIFAVGYLQGTFNHQDGV